MKTWHWAALAAVLTAVWLGFMIFVSYESYRDRDPKPIVSGAQDSSTRQAPTPANQ